MKLILTVIALVVALTGTAHAKPVTVNAQQGLTQDMVQYRLDAECFNTCMARTVDLAEPLITECQTYECNYKPYTEIETKRQLWCSSKVKAFNPYMVNWDSVVYLCMEECGYTPGG